MSDLKFPPLPSSSDEDKIWGGWKQLCHEELARVHPVLMKLLIGAGKLEPTKGATMSSDNTLKSDASDSEKTSYTRSAVICPGRDERVIQVGERVQTSLGPGIVRGVVTANVKAGRWDGEVERRTTFSVTLDGDTHPRGLDQDQVSPILLTLEDVARAAGWELTEQQRKADQGVRWFLGDTAQDRGSGRTSLILLQAIQDALNSPAQRIPVVDHRPASSSQTRKLETMAEGLATTIGASSRLQLRQGSLHVLIDPLSFRYVP